MQKTVAVHIPGRIPHRIPEGEVEKFLRDHPGAAVSAPEEAPPRPEAKRRGRLPKAV